MLALLLALALSTADAGSKELPAAGTQQATPQQRAGADERGEDAPPPAQAGGGAPDGSPLIGSKPARARRKKEAKAQSLALEAEQARTQGDLLTALSTSSKALKKDPDNVLALATRGLVFMAFSEQLLATDPNLATQAYEAGLSDLQRLTVLAPDSQLAAIARDAVRQRSPAPPVLSEPTAVCSAEAEQAMQVAEIAFGRQDLESARKAYAQATSACPSNATWWVYYGDAYFQDRNYDGAIEMYRKALAIEPCYWVAHRFTADALLSEGKKPEAYGEMVRAVACNPQYESGWTYLDQYVEHNGGQYSRVAVSPPPPGTVSVDPDDMAAMGPWLAYQSTLQATTGSPLERRRAAVRAGLELVDPLSPPKDPAWSLFLDAERNGQLDEAIFVTMLDEELLPEYLAERKDHLDRLERYISTRLAAVP